MKKILTSLMVLAMIASLVACGGGKNPAGTYDLTKMSGDGEEITVEELDEISGTEVGVSLEMTEDNNFTLNMGILGDEENESISGTWKMDGDSLILSVEGEEVSGTYDGKIIVLDMEDVIFTFEKQ